MFMIRFVQNEKWSIFIIFSDLCQKGEKKQHVRTLFGKFARCRQGLDRKMHRADIQRQFNLNIILNFISRSCIKFNKSNSVVATASQFDKFEKK